MPAAQLTFQVGEHLSKAPLTKLPEFPTPRSHLNKPLLTFPLCNTPPSLALCPTLVGRHTLPCFALSLFSILSRGVAALKAAMLPAGPARPPFPPRQAPFAQHSLSCSNFYLTHSLALVHATSEPGHALTEAAPLLPAAHRPDQASFCASLVREGPPVLST